MLDLKYNLLKQFFFLGGSTVVICGLCLLVCKLGLVMSCSHQRSLGLLFLYPVQPSSPFRPVAVVANTISDSPDAPAVL